MGDERCYLCGYLRSEHLLNKCPKPRNSKKEWESWGAGTALKVGGITMYIVKDAGPEHRWVMFTEPKIFKFVSLASPDLEQTKTQARAILQVYLQDALKDLIGEAS